MNVPSNILYHVAKQRLTVLLGCDIDFRFYNMLILFQNVFGKYDRMCCECVMYVSCMCHVCVMYVSCMCHVCVMHVSCMCHVCVMCVSCMCHVCVIYQEVCNMRTNTAIQQIQRLYIHYSNS